MFIQLLYAIGVFLLFFAIGNLRIFITDYVIRDREWSFKKHLKFTLIIALIFRTVTGQAAPKKVQELLQSPEVQRAIDKGMTYLGY